MNNKLRNNNIGEAPNKLVIDEQFKSNIQKYFSKKQRKIHLEKQLADICQRKHKAFTNSHAINVNGLLINLKVRALSESTKITNHKIKIDSKNANTNYKKIKDKK